MPLLVIVLVLIAVGICLYVVQRFIPMDATIKSIIHVVVIIFVVIWLLKVFGILDYLMKIKV